MTPRCLRGLILGSHRLLNGTVSALRRCSADHVSLVGSRRHRPARRAEGRRPDVGCATVESVAPAEQDTAWKREEPTARRPAADRLTGTLSQTRLQELLVEVQDGIEEIVSNTRNRMDGLLAAVLAVSSGLELDVTLRQIVQAATELVGADTARWACSTTTACSASSSTSVWTTQLGS